MATVIPVLSTQPWLPGSKLGQFNERLASILGFVGVLHLMQILWV